MLRQGAIISYLRSKFEKAKSIYQRTAFKLQYYSRKSLFKVRLRFPHFKKTHFNAFPAVQFKKFDTLDYFMKFSSEAVVIGLALLVAALNIWFFSGKKEFADQSPASKFLAFHKSFNQRLYAKQVSIKTVVVRDSGFVAMASAADTVDGLDASSVVNPDASSTGTESSMIVNDTLAPSNPDSIKDLISKQVKIYTTQAGDTLNSIAQKNGISTQTIISANKLPSLTIKPGWNLMILPTDGVLVKATSNDTLPDIAKKYSGNLDTIISYNGLGGAEDITADQLIIVPGGKMPEPPKPKTTTPKKKSSGSSGIEYVPKQYVDDGSSHIFPRGYCTWYVAQKVNIPWGGNAKSWLANAQAYGAVVTRTPVKGAIVVTTDSARYGHVAYVESVDANGFTVSEMNYTAFGKVDTRWISKSSPTVRGFILP